MPQSFKKVIKKMKTTERKNIYILNFVHLVALYVCEVDFIFISIYHYIFVGMNNLYQSKKTINNVLEQAMHKLLKNSDYFFHMQSFSDEDLFKLTILVEVLPFCHG